MTRLLLRLLVLVLLAIAAAWPVTDTHAANLKIGIVMEARQALGGWL